MRRVLLEVLLEVLPVKLAGQEGRLAHLPLLAGRQLVHQHPHLAGGQLVAQAPQPLR